MNILMICCIFKEFNEKETGEGTIFKKYNALSLGKAYVVDKEISLYRLKAIRK